MSSTIDKIHELYEDYLELCLKYKAVALGSYEHGWYSHYIELRDKDEKN